ncbi:MAG: prolipoprotein diacylglyceryl transferase, partial [Candidatus Eisenbacteria bacterium]|nr:prolipoprotein diacylglyceryl transferase [Candidatus Eisenbacteria bacterium]
GSVVLGAMIGGVLGAKLYYLIDHWDQTVLDPRGQILTGAGLTYYGGLLGGALLAFFAAWRNKVPFLQLIDMCAPLMALGYAIGRFGCFLNGDDYGLPTDVPWGMSFPKGSPPTLETVHPTQMYEVLWGGAIFAFLWMIRKANEMYLGRMFGLYLILAGIERFVVEYWRTNVPMGGLTVAQWISVVLFSIGIVLVVLSNRRALEVQESRAV